MKYATVEDVISSFPHPVLPSATAEPDYHTLHVIHKILRANALSAIVWLLIVRKIV
jgi:hypothetical protein